LYLNTSADSAYGWPFKTSGAIHCRETERRELGRDRKWIQRRGEDAVKIGEVESKRAREGGGMDREIETETQRVVVYVTCTVPTFAVMVVLRSRRRASPKSQI
jgi:hypothetical protein